MINDNDSESVSRIVFSHDNKENYSPSASDTDVEAEAVIENEDASSCEALSRTSLKASVAPSKRKKKTSWVWDYFKTIASDKKNVFCTLCARNVNYGESRSTGMLERHVQRRHLKVYSDETAKAVRKILDAQADSTTFTSASTMTQSSLSGFVVPCPSFEESLLKWMIKTYQPLCAVEDEEFRDMCRSISKKCPILGVDKLTRLLKIEFHAVKAKLMAIFKGRHFAMTTDAWTSITKVGYVTCTIHFIDQDTWRLHSMVLGLYEKTGRSRAQDCVGYAEQQMDDYGLPYSHMTAVVTDTEATMVAAGRLFVEHSRNAHGDTAWHGCIDHQLELVTGIAFTDDAETLGTMSACRALINFFNSSSQAMGKLLSKQQVGRAVRPIQDVVTRWWSTYSMTERLLRLRPYLALLEEEGDLDCNLTDSQWHIITNLKVLLQPFMIAQKLLEGQTYVTVSLIPYMVYKIRKGLISAIGHQQAPNHVINTGTKMLHKLNSIIGTGEEGTVADEFERQGVRGRPKGIPRLVLMASLLDPRMKSGLGIPPNDKEQIWSEIHDALIRLALEDDAEIPVHAPTANANNNNQRCQRGAPLIEEAVDNYFFDELKDVYRAERLRNNNDENANENEFQRRADRVIEAVMAEVTLFQDEPSLPLQDDDGKFSCPLQWWKYNQQKYKVIAKLAIRLLCIPATSAPSERVFSVAGLTIAKDRSRLAPHTAHELIFLHDAIPALRRFEES